MIKLILFGSNSKRVIVIALLVAIWCLINMGHILLAVIVAYVTYKGVIK